MAPGLRERTEPATVGGARKRRGRSAPARARGAEVSRGRCAHGRAGQASLGGEVGAPSPTGMLVAGRERPPRLQPNPLGPDREPAPYAGLSRRPSCRSRGPPPT